MVRSSRTQPGTVGYHLGKSPMMQCIAEGKKVPTFETLFCLMLQYIAEGKKVPTFETLFCLMLMWVLILSTELYSLVLAAGALPCSFEHRIFSSLVLVVSALPCALWKSRQQDQFS